MKPESKSLNRANREVRKADNTETWNQYLHKHPKSNFYQRFEWNAINQRNFNHASYFLGVYENEKLVGVFPFVFIKSRMTGKILTSMPYVNFGGICADDRNSAELLLKNAKLYCEYNKADYLEIRSLETASDTLPTSRHKVSLTIDLCNNADDHWDQFQSKHRTNIRRVVKNGIYVRQGHLELLDEFYYVLASNWKSLGTPIYRKSYFKDIMQTFGDSVKIFVAYQGNQAIATAFNGYYKSTVEGMWAGTLPNARKIAPNYVLYWEMIKDSCEAGYSCYHLGRSTANSNAESFKKKWDAYSSQIYYQYILSEPHQIPGLNKENPKFQLAINIWKKLPLKLTMLFGPLISRNIP